MLLEFLANESLSLEIPIERYEKDNLILRYFYNFTIKLWAHTSLKGLVL